jgi:putative endonuclease
MEGSVICLMRLQSKVLECFLFVLKIMIDRYGKLRGVGDSTVRKGKDGEGLAVKYLQEKGFKIVERNYRAGRKEIDIIAELPDTIVFVEVKFRESDTLASPFEAVNIRKQQNIFRVANSYVRSRKINKDVRFDIIGIVAGVSGQNSSRHNRIEHIEGAFSVFGG